jgi:hypothetical protein
MSVVNSSHPKFDEVQFYLDRSKESVITLIKSIIGNPRLPDEVQYASLHLIADHHAAVAELIEAKLRAGEEAGLALASKAVQSCQ